MKIQELRIGNLVKCKTSNDSATYSVIQIDGFGLKVRLSHPRHTEFTPLDRIKPIPLTEEILSEFTMKWGTDPQEPNALMVFKNGEFEILKFEDEDHFFYSNGRGFHADIIYLHQLQNLYFDLTGEELEVKL